MTDKEFLAKERAERLETIWSMVEDAKVEVFRSIRRDIEQAKKRGAKDSSNSEENSATMD